MKKTTTDIILERIENLEQQVKIIEQIINQLTEEYNTDKKQNDFIRFN